MRWLIRVMMVMAMSVAIGADGLPQKDKEIIEQVIAGVKARKDMKFVRLDKEYGPKEAAWYLKYKWDHNKEKVHSVEDFVNLSSYGGDHGEVTYYVKFSDGKEKPAKEVLEEAVRKLEGDNKGGEKQ